MNIQDAPVNFKKIKKVLEFVWNSPYSSFYRDKYNKAGINLLKDINSLEDFKKLPFLTKEEILKVALYDRIYFPREKIKGIQVSSATTGGKGVLIIPRAGFYHPADKLAVKKALDLKIKTAIVIFSGTTAWALNRPTLKHKSILRILGNINNLENTVKIIKGLEVEAIVASATTLEQLIPLLKKEQVLDQIRFIGIAGELCSKLRVEYFKKIFKNAYFRFAYNLTESRATSYSCDYCNEKADNAFHPLPLYTYYEIINPQKESELVLTSLYSKTEFPIIRYKTGDRASLYQEDCECGRNLKIKIYGKIGLDVVIVKGNLIYREQVDNAIYPAGRYLKSAAWRLIINDCKALLKFKLQLIVKERTQEVREKLQRVISDNWVFKDKALSALVKEKIFRPLEIEFIDDFGIHSKQKSIFVETI